MKHTRSKIRSGHFSWASCYSRKSPRNNRQYVLYALLLLSTIENNWGLYNLGSGDVNANYSNVFQLVADVTGWRNVNVASRDIPYLNFTASGYFDTSNEGPIPAVMKVPGPGGRGLLPSLVGVNGSVIPAPPSSASSTASGTAAASSSSAPTSAAVRQFTYSFGALTGCICVIVAFSIGLVV